MNSLIAKYKKYGNKNLHPIISWVDYLWRKEYLWIFLTLAVIASFILIYFGATLSDYILTYTGIVIFWYTRETMDLKRNSNKEIEHLRKQFTTSIRPYLRLQKKAGEDKLQLVNEGKGVAVNLRPVYRRDSTEQEMLKIPAMAAAPNSVTESFAPRSLGLELDPSAANFTIDIVYEDIEGRRYIAAFKSNTAFNDGFEIIKQLEHNG